MYIFRMDHHHDNDNTQHHPAADLYHPQHRMLRALNWNNLMNLDADEKLEQLLMQNDDNNNNHNRMIPPALNAP